MELPNRICGHCGTAFFPQWERTKVFFYQEGEGGECVAAARCPSCHNINVRLERGDHRNVGSRFDDVDWDVDEIVQLFPVREERSPAPLEVPAEIRKDYAEAWAVLDHSAKAAAALARRCLQAVLVEQGYRGHDLNKQIDAVLAETDARKALPGLLHETIDAIRNFGNFSAHPINDRTTLHVIDVEPGEAEFCLRILHELFDHFS